MEKVFQITVLVILTICQSQALNVDPVQQVNAFARQFNSLFNLESGLQMARAESKPVMLIVHKSRCPACISLRPLLMESNDVNQLSQNFVIVNVVDGQDQQAWKVTPDGGYYYPRIIFFSSNGRILSQVSNPLQPKFRYYYETANDVAKAMNTALQLNGRIN